MTRVEESRTVRGKDASDGFVAFVRGRAGRTVRVIGRYERADSRVLYCREDLSRERLAERVDALRESIVLAWDPDDRDALAELGERQSTVRVREDAVFVDVRQGRDCGYVIGFEHDAARDLTSFLGECFERIQ